MVGVRGREIDPEATGVGTGPGGGGALRRLTSHRGAGPVLLAGAWLVLALCSVAALVLADGSYHPNADHALIELHVRDVGSEEVLLGPYSRFGWSHPGPLLYYVLAVPFRLLGSASGAIAAGAVVVNTVALAGITAVAWRRGGPAVGLLAFTLFGLTVRSLGAEFLRDAWNPHLPVLPFALLVLVAWPLALGKGWALPVTAALASFVAQSHLGFAPATAVVVAVACVGFVRSRPARPLPPVGIAIAILAVLWFPPVLEEVLRRPGNLRVLLDFYGEDRPTVGLAEGVRTVFHQLGPTPEWLVGRRPTNAFSGVAELPSGTVPVALVALALAAVFAHRRGWRDLTWLAGIVTALVLAAVASMSRVVGELYAYLTVWTWLPGVLLWLVVGATLLRWVSEERPALSRPITGGLALVGAVLLVVNSVAAAGAGIPKVDESRIVGELGAGLRAHLPADAEVVHVEGSASFDALVYMPGVALELERDGRRVETAVRDAAAFGRHRVTCTDGAAVVVVTADEPAREAARAAGLEPIVRAGVRSEADHDRLRRERALVEARAGPVSSEELFRLVQEVPDPGLEIVLYRGGTRRCPEPSS